MLTRRALALLPIALLLVTARPVAVAQEASPVASPAAGGAPLDLAAMTLVSADLPVQYDLGPETFYRAPDGVLVFGGGYATPEEITAAGLRGTYESQFLTPDGQSLIRSYVEEYASPDLVAAGFAIFEDEARWAAANGPDSELRDLADEPAVGEAPRETTLGTIRYADGSTPVQTADVTFRVDRVLAGVAVERFEETAPAPDPRLALDLAQKLEARVRLVLAGITPPGIDPSLRDLTLPLQEPWSAAGSWAEGYRDADEMLAGAGTLAHYTAFRGGFSRSVDAGLDPANPEATAPYITIGLTAFAANEDAAGAFDGAPYLPMPTWLPTGGYRQQLDPPAIPGADDVYASDGSFVVGEPADSARIVFRVDAIMTTVDVQDAQTAEQALAIAVDLAIQQATCLVVGGTCATMTVPAAFETPPGTPVATPMA